MFGENFCYIVDELKPLNTIPFAADYVLLNNEKRWINNVKLSKQQIKDYYFNIYKGSNTNFIIAHPGDRIEKEEFELRSGFHELEKKHSLDYLINESLSAEIKSVNEIVYIPEAEITALQHAIYRNVANRSMLFSAENLSHIKFTIAVKDIEHGNYFYVDCSKKNIAIERRDDALPGSILTLETTSKVLNYCFASEWGGDAIIIGYGAEIYIHYKSIIEKNLDIICVRLLTNQPIASKQMKASPFRALKYLASNPLTTSWLFKQMISGRNTVNKNPINERNLWLAKSKCEICQVCNIPLLSQAFAESLNK